MNKLIATAVLTLLAPFLLAMPAHAEEPQPDPCQATIALLNDEVAYWQDETERVREIGWQREQALLARALAAEDRVLAYAERLGARTQQRNRILRANHRLLARNAHMKATIARLRAQVRNEPVG